MGSVTLFIFSLLLLTVLGGTTVWPNNVSSTPTPADVHIVASPNAIHEGFTKYLGINCTFNHAQNSDFRTIMSLILSKTSGPQDTTFNEIATVTAFSNNVEVTNAMGATVKGHLEANSESFISFEWKYPTSDVEGQYRCEAYGMDHRGHPRDKSAITTVTERAVDMSMVLENMKKMDVELDELLTFKQDVTSRLLQSMMALMEDSASYSGKMYYLSRPMVRNTAVADSLCHLYGGKLLEVNDISEMNFISSFVQNKIMNDSSIALGATDEVNEGTWTYLSSGSNVNFLQWESGHVNAGSDKNCLYLGNRDNGVAMFDDFCYELAFDRFICEV